MVTDESLESWYAGREDGDVEFDSRPVDRGYKLIFPVISFDLTTRKNRKCADK